MRFYKPVSGGVELPELTNPATAGDILSGTEAIDQDGNKLTGSHSCSTLEELTADADAANTDIMSGKTAYVKGSKVTGSHVCKTVAELTADADATAADIMSGKTAYVDGVKVTGEAVAKEAKSITYKAERWNGSNGVWTSLGVGVFKTAYNGNAANPITIGIGSYFYMFESVSYDERYRVLATVNY